MYAWCRKSTPCAGRAADEHLGVAGKPAAGISSPRSRLTNACACGIAVVVPPGDDHLLVAPASGRRSGRRRRRRPRATSRIAPQPRPRAGRSPPAPRARAPSRPAVCTSTCAGATAPGPTARRSTSKPRIDCGVRGMPKVEPGVSSSENAGTAAATRSAAPPTRNATGLAMIAAREPRPAAPCSGSPGSPGRIRLRAVPRRP